MIIYEMKSTPLIGLCAAAALLTATACSPKIAASLASVHSEP